MKAIVTKSFIGRRDDRAESETFAVGSEIDGELAESAVNQKNAEFAGKKQGGKGRKSDLSKLSRPDLEKLAAEQEIDVPEAATDADIVALLEAGK
ncbi:hypothetical protein [Mesorhizobium japonicum]|nr:hypothetical protein [Mesorhizobium japonicum]